MTNTGSASHWSTAQRTSRVPGPAGLITASAAGLLTFARSHLEGGVTPGGDRLLTRAHAEAMREPGFPVPGIGGHAGWVGLAWRLNRWGDRLVFGHDGSTIGQSAYLRIDPRARMAVCLLTNATNGHALYQALFSEVFSTFCGLSLPALPRPAAGEAGADIGRHAGRYERAAHRFDISVRDGALHAVSAATAARAGHGVGTGGA